MRSVRWRALPGVLIPSGLLQDNQAVSRAHTWH